MKKGFSIAVAFVYILITSGFVVEVNKCFAPQPCTLAAMRSHQHCPACAGNNDQQQCCPSAHKYFRIGDVHKAATGVNIQLQPVKEMQAQPAKAVFPLSFLPLPFRSLSTLQVQKLPLFLRHCVLLI